MIQRTTHAGDTQTIFQQVYNDMAANGTSDYHALLESENAKIELDIMSSPGGSIEGGYEQTMLVAELPVQSDFRFAIFPEDFLNRIGKLFGTQDVKIGYPEFDESVIIQTNDEQRLKTLFEEEGIRTLFGSMSGFSFHIDKHKEREGDHLHLVIQRALTNLTELQTVFLAFTSVLAKLSGNAVTTKAPTADAETAEVRITDADMAAAAVVTSTDYSRGDASAVGTEVGAVVNTSVPPYTPSPDERTLNQQSLAVAETNEDVYPDEISAITETDEDVSTDVNRPAGRTNARIFPNSDV